MSAHIHILSSFNQYLVLSVVGGISFILDTRICDMYCILLCVLLAVRREALWLLCVVQQVPGGGAEEDAMFSVAG